MESKQTEVLDQAELPPLPAAVRRSIDKVKPLFSDFVNGFSGLAVKREDVAPRFMKAFAAYQQAREGATFVSFVQLMDETVPTDRSGYKSHRAYQAADYLRRLHASMQQKAEGKERSKGPAPAKPLDAVARLVASLFPIIPENEREKVFQAMRNELHWTDRQVDRIKVMLESVSPLITAKAPRGVSMPVLKVQIAHQEGDSAAA